MTIYVQLATSTRLDPRIAPLSDRAFRAYIDALCLWKEGQLDGVIPLAVVEESKRLSASIRELTASGAFVAVDGGYAVLSIQPQTTRAQDEAASEAKREAKRAGGRARSENANRDGMGHFTQQNPADTQQPAPAQIRSDQSKAKQSATDVPDAAALAFGMSLIPKTAPET